MRMVLMSLLSEHRTMRKAIAGGVLAALLLGGSAVAAGPADDEDLLTAAEQRLSARGFLADAAQGKSVVISGGGWGHGIGMSQYGAYGRALKGASSNGILEHYYKGAGVENRKMPRRVRVGLLQGRSQIQTSSSAFESGGGAVAFKVRGSKQTIAEGGAGTNWRVEASSTGGMRLFKNGDKVSKGGKTVFGSSSKPLQLIFESHGSLVSVAGKSYDYAYGRMEFGTYSTPCSGDYCLRLVLVIGMQKYLYGLSEVPSSWPASALQAQAIAGRTYAYSKIKRLGQHLSPCDCAVYDSTVDQAYAGDGKRTGSGAYWADWKGAVNATKGKVILYEGDPVQALYSSSSGGHTENNENVWGGTPIPYLRGVVDGPDDVDANPNHKWKLTMSWSQFSDKLNAGFGTGALKRFRIMLPVGVSGRVTVVRSSDAGGVRIVGGSKTVRADGWDVRSALSLKDTLFRVRVTD
jgi:stage II sporulation protein D